jgi:hypothetical protein
MLPVSAGLVNNKLRVTTGQRVVTGQNSQSPKEVGENGLQEIIKLK